MPNRAYKGTGGGRPVGTLDGGGPASKAAKAKAMERLEAEARERLLTLAKTQLTGELIDQICEHIGSGNYPSVIAESLGVTAATFLNWMRQGRTAWETQDAPETMFTNVRDPRGLRVELYLRVSQVEAEWEVGLVREMDEKVRSGSYWAGHMTILQRRKPERWDARGRQEGGTEKTLEERLAELEKERGASTVA